MKNIKLTMEEIELVLESLSKMDSVKDRDRYINIYKNIVKQLKEQDK